jgi:hypothetical protein
LDGCSPGSRPFCGSRLRSPPSETGTSTSATRQAPARTLLGEDVEPAVELRLLQGHGPPLATSAQKRPLACSLARLLAGLAKSKTSRSPRSHQRITFITALRPASQSIPTGSRPGCSNAHRRVRLSALGHPTDGPLAHSRLGTRHSALLVIPHSGTPRVFRILH